MPATPPTSAKSKSRITNGSLFGAHVNTRMAPARRLRDLISGYAAMFGNKPSLPQANTIRRLAAFDMALEKHEDDLAAGKPVDMTQYAALANAHRRTLESLGLVAASAPPEPPKTPKYDLSAIRFIGRDNTSPDEDEPTIRVVAAPVRTEEGEDA